MVWVVRIRPGKIDCANSFLHAWVGRGGEEDVNDRGVVDGQGHNPIASSACICEQNCVFSGYSSLGLLNFGSV